MRKITLLIIPLLGFPCALVAAPAKRTLVYQAESAHINPKRAEIVEQASFKDGRGVALKDGMPAVGPTNDTPPDLIFSINEPTAGRFVLRTYAAVDDAGAEQMRRASSKHHSLFADIQIDARRPTRRVVCPVERTGTLHQSSAFRPDQRYAINQVLVAAPCTA